MANQNQDKSENIVDLESHEEEEAHSIWANYVIMKEVMQNLNWSERKETRNVCKLWCDIVRELEKIDLHLHHFRITHSGTVPMKDFTLVSSASNSVEPDLVIIFSLHKRVHYPFPGSIVGLPHPFDKRMVTVFEHLAAKYFGPTNRIFGVCSNQIFYRSKITPANTNILSSGFSIPKIPGVSVHIVNIRKDEYINEYQFSPSISEIMDEEFIKCVLIFSTNKRYEMQEKYAEQLICDIDDRQGNSDPLVPFALGGCLIKFSHDQSLDRSDLAGHSLNIVILSVKKSEYKSVQFDAYSTVFSYYSKSDDSAILNFTQKLQKIAKSISLRKHSVCLKLSCYKRKTVFEREIVLLSESFPQTPIIGCEASGEIGIECLPDGALDDEEPDLKKMRCLSDTDCFYGFSTVIVLLTWGQSL